MQMFWRIARTVSIVASVVSASITSLAGSVPAWPQWGQNPQHSGTAVAAGEDLNRILADHTFDPFVPQETKAPCNFCTDYPAPFVAGPLAADAAGNIYYNALKFDPADPYGASGTDIAGAWLVRIGADGSARSVEYRTLVPDAPTMCTTTFSLGQLPWPPSPTATPPQGACGSQRPGINVAPAIAPDGTIYTVSRAHLRTRYSYMVALTADLRPQWHTSLRDFLND